MPAVPAAILTPKGGDPHAENCLTQLSADRLSPPKTGRVIHWDRTLSGFGLRVTVPVAAS